MKKFIYLFFFPCIIKNWCLQNAPDKPERQEQDTISAFIVYTLLLVLFKKRKTLSPISSICSKAKNCFFFFFSENVHTLKKLYFFENEHILTIFFFKCGSHIDTQKSTNATTLNAFVQQSTVSLNIRMLASA